VPDPYLPMQSQSTPCPSSIIFQVSLCSAGFLSDDAVESLLEPLDSLVTVDAVMGAQSALASATAGNTLTGAGHAAVEVHAVDTDRGVVLDTEIDVLADTEAEVARLAEVALAQLVLLDLQATLQDLLSLRATNGNVDSDLLVTSDTEGSDSVAGLAVNRSLTAQLLQHLRGTGQTITRLANRDVQNKLLDAELPHGVLRLLGHDGCSVSRNRGWWEAGGL
jgi:hypothetical protein